MLRELATLGLILGGVALGYRAPSGQSGFLLGYIVALVVQIQRLAMSSTRVEKPFSAEDFEAEIRRLDKKE